ncbi:MAG: hypothetical protein QUV06_01475 [Cyanobium sp. CZS 48M]|nr:hypothetical protein [Cyanobium sp. CZS48M]
MVAWTRCYRQLRGWLIDEQVGESSRSARPTLAGHLTISAGLILLAMVLYWGVFFTVSGISSRWTICQGQPMNSDERERQLADLNNRLINIDTRIGRLSTVGVDVSITPGQTQRLKEQISQLDQGRRLACTVGVFYFSHRYAALSLSTAAGILALSSLALISKQGWEKSNNAIINIGITSGLVLYSAWTFSQLYGQASNYENYNRKYVLANDLISTIESAVANGSAVISANQEPTNLNLASKPDMATLISHVDERLRVINKPEFTGDASFAEDSFQTIRGFIKPGAPQQPPPNR